MVTSRLDLYRYRKKYLKTENNRQSKRESEYFLYLSLREEKGSILNFFFFKTNWCSGGKIMMKLCSKGHLHMCYFYALALFRRGGGSGDFRLEAKYM